MFTKLEAEYMEELLYRERKTLMNNRTQTRDSVKKHIYEIKAILIDAIVPKLKQLIADAKKHGSPCTGPEN